MIRVRFAPSPTGFLHIGSAKTALYDELFARQQNGVFVLRIEDTNQARKVPGAVENVLRTFAWLGLQVDEGPYLADDGSIKERGAYGPYVQSARLSLYRQYAEQLLANGQAYYCFCTPEEIEEIRQVHIAAKRPVLYDRRCRHLDQKKIDEKITAGAMRVLRLKVPEQGTTVTHDLLRGKIEVHNATINDLIIMKSDGFPTYHLAVVVDDHLMEISHILRGDEWISSMPQHVLLYQAFGWTPPVFVHLPLLLNPDRTKLSKRQGDVAVEDYRTRGYLPEALVNFIALIGWNPSGTQEIYSKKELIEKFDLEKINTSGAIFNREKLDWLNREYIKKKSPDALYVLLKPFLEKHDVSAVPVDRIERLIALEQPRATTLMDLAEGVGALAVTPLVVDVTLLVAKKSTRDRARQCLVGLRQHIANIRDTDFSDVRNLEKNIIMFVANQEWTNSESLWPLRVALTNSPISPSPFEMLWVLGHTESLARIDRACNALT